MQQDPGKRLLKQPLLSFTDGFMKICNRGAAFLRLKLSHLPGFFRVSPAVHRLGDQHPDSAITLDSIKRTDTIFNVRNRYFFPLGGRTCVALFWGGGGVGGGAEQAG